MELINGDPREGIKKGVELRIKFVDGWSEKSILIKDDEISW